MSTHKRIDGICIIAVLLAVILTVLLMIGGGFGVIPVISAEAGNDLFTANDLNGDWDTSSATKILLSDDGSRISGNGAYVYDGKVYIAYPGHYVLSGELTDGSVVIDAGKSDKIWILLDGVSIHCEDDAAIRVEQADKVFLTLGEGKSNTVSSGAEYDEEVIASGVDGVIYSRDDLTINGTGALTVNAEYYHGIVCNDDLMITGGNITVNAVQDGIHANDSVRIREATITVSAGDDGITVSNDDETDFLYVESGSITIPACYEGLEATEITIAGGSLYICPTDDGINAAGSGSASVIRITDGDVTIINPSGRDADGLDSNGSIYVEGGRVFISVSGSGGNCAIDYGSENGGECMISGGTVIACGGSTMAEGFDADSPQGFLMYNVNGAAGTAISLTDSAGKELLSEEIPCGFTSAVLSVPGMKTGDVCTITMGDVGEQVTIDNSSASGFGMFGGGMRGGRGDNGGNGISNGMKGRDGMNMPGETEGPDGGAGFGRTELPGEESGFGGTEPPDGANVPEGMEFPGREDMPAGERGPGGQEMREGSMPAMPDGERLQEVGAFGGRSPQQNWGEMPSARDTSAFRVSADTLALLGISAAVLLIGLLIAVKVRH